MKKVKLFIYKTKMQNAYPSFGTLILIYLQASFVLCRVFNKSCPRNSISENGLVSCAEESFSAVRHIGIQHDGDNISSRNYDIEVDDQIATRPAPMASIQVPLCSEPNTQVIYLSLAEKCYLPPFLLLFLFYHISSKDIARP